MDDQPTTTTTPTPTPAPEPPAAPQPEAKKRSFPTKKVLALLGLLVVLAGSVAAAYLWQQGKIDSLQQKNQQLEAAADSSVDGSAGATEPSDVPVSSPVAGTPIVGFIPDGKFTAEEKASLKQKLINPMYDYAPEQYAAIIVESYDPGKFVNPGDSKYIVTYLGLKEGQWGGFLFGSKSTAVIDWWVPECMDECTFTDAYRAKYPEVVKKTES